MKAQLFALLVAELDDSLTALGRAIAYARRRDHVLVRRTFVRASDVLRGRVTTRRIRGKQRDSIALAC